MASYNYERYIGRAIESVIRQTMTEWELLVVDDGSVDNSIAVINKYANVDPRIRLLRHPNGVNRGLNETLQLGFRAAKAALVTFLESDDLWESSCLQTRFDIFTRFDPDVVFNNGTTVLESSCQDGSVSRFFSNLNVRFPDAGFVSIASYVWVSSVIPSFSCVMLKKTLVLDCDFDPPIKEWLDWWLWFQLADRAKFFYCKERLTVRRIHNISYSHLVDADFSKRRKMLSKFVELRNGVCPKFVTLMGILPFLSVSVANSAWLLLLRMRKRVNELFRS